MPRNYSLFIVLSGVVLSACSDDGDGTSVTVTYPGVTSASAGATSATSATADPTADSTTGPTTGPTTGTTPGTSAGTTEPASATESPTTGSASTAATTEDSTGSTTDSSGTTTGSGGTTTTTTTGGRDPLCTPNPPIEPPGNCAQIGVTIEPPYDQWYTCYDLGVIPGVPIEWGGIIVDRDDSNVLLAGGAGNTLDGKLYAVSIARDAGCHVVGYQNVPTTVYSTAEYIDGGLTYHHDSHVLFLSRWPYNELGQLKPGSKVTDKVIDLNLFDINSSPGGFTFVPPGFSGAGKLKAVSWPNGWFYTVDIAPDGNGTFDITAATHHTTIGGGPEAFVYISDENPEFPIDSMLVAEWSAGNIAAYQIDNVGNPLPATRKLFIKGLQGAESAHVDAVSGDFLFATYAGDERLIAVRGFTPQPQ